MYGRYQYVLFDPSHHVIIDDWGWAIRAHAARVWTSVSVKRRLMILGGWQWNNGLAVGDGQDAGLLAF